MNKKTFNDISYPKVLIKFKIKLFETTNYDNKCNCYPCLCEKV